MGGQVHRGFRGSHKQLDQRGLFLARLRQSLREMERAAPVGLPGLVCVMRMVLALRDKASERLPNATLGPAAAVRRDVLVPHRLVEALSPFLNIVSIITCFTDDGHSNGDKLPTTQLHQHNSPHNFDGCLLRFGYR